MNMLTAVVATIIVLAAKDLLKDELRGHLERMPHRLLRLARLRLPPELQDRLYDGEWLPELEHIWTRLESMPLTRLLIGTRYALGLLRAAPRIARELGVPRRRHVAMPLLLLAGTVAALVGLMSSLGVFGALPGAVVSVLAGVVVVAVVFQVEETIARDLRRGGGRREPWA